jgi:hypothetical protein
MAFVNVNKVDVSFVEETAQGSALTAHINSRIASLVSACGGSTRFNYTRTDVSYIKEQVIIPNAADGTCSDGTSTSQTECVAVNPVTGLFGTWTPAVMTIFPYFLVSISYIQVTGSA